MSARRVFPDMGGNDLRDLLQVQPTLRDVEDEVECLVVRERRLVAVESDEDEGEAERDALVAIEQRVVLSYRTVSAAAFASNVGYASAPNIPADGRASAEKSSPSSRTCRPSFAIRARAW